MRYKLAMMAVVAAAMVLAVSATKAEDAKKDEGVKVDEKLGKYESVPGISGSVSSIGSDTLANLMTLWTEGFRKSYPNVTFTVESKGSSTAPPALIDGTSHM